MNTLDETYDRIEAYQEADNEASFIKLIKGERIITMTYNDFIALVLNSLPDYRIYKPAIQIKTLLNGNIDIPINEAVSFLDLSLQSSVSGGIYVNDSNEIVNISDFPAGYRRLYKVPSIKNTLAFFSEHMNEITYRPIILKGSDEFTGLYICKDMLSLRILILSKMHIHKMLIKKCPVCNKYFVPESRSDEIYCDRVIDGKSCKDRGYYLMLQTDPSKEIEKEYRKIYKTKFAQKQRLMYGNDQKRKDKVNKKFFTWAKKAAEKKDMAKNGDMTKEEFYEWLNKPVDWSKKNGIDKKKK